MSFLTNAEVERLCVELSVDCEDRGALIALRDLLQGFPYNGKQLWSNRDVIAARLALSREKPGARCTFADVYHAVASLHHAGDLRTTERSDGQEGPTWTPPNITRRSTA